MKGDGKVCPLCHNPLDGEAEALPVFPPRKQRKLIKRQFTFSGLYAAISAVIMAVCVVFNIIFPTEVIWSLVVLISLGYVHFLIKNTIMYKGDGGYRIYAQTLTLSLYVILLQYILHTEDWAYAYAMPIICMSSMLMQALFLSIRHKKSPHHYVRYAIWTAIVGCIPILLYLFKVFTFPYLALASFIMAVLCIGLMLLLFMRILKTEVNKNIHI